MLSSVSLKRMDQLLVPGDAKQQIALYDAETGATAVAPMANPTTGMLADGPDGNDTGVLNLFDGPSGDQIPLSGDNLAKTCWLFEEGG